jgi:hypothetical protein
MLNIEGLDTNNNNLLKDMESMGIPFNLFITKDNKLRLEFERGQIDIKSNQEAATVLSALIYLWEFAWLKGQNKALKEVILNLKNI